MANVSEAAVCAACGRRLPPQRGRGRRRRYCDATCRDLARRQRARSHPAGTDGSVKGILTSRARHGYLDSGDGVSRQGDPVMLRLDATAGRVIEEFGRVGPPLDLVLAARDLVAASEVALQAAVDRARAEGQSWRDIGTVLGTTRQAAFQRFGLPVDPRAGTPMSREVPADAAERAVRIFTWHDQGRFREISREFDDNLRRRLDAERMGSGRAHVAGLYGRLERIGEPFAHRAGDDVMVDVPLHFEAGDARGIVRFDRDGKIAGLAIRPASPWTG